MSGAMASIELKHLIRDRDRHGNVRVYVRVPGKKKVRIRAAEGTPEFMDAYHAALAGLEQAPSRLPRPAPGTIGSLILHYQASRAFRELDISTRTVRARILSRINAKVGAFAAELIEPVHVRTWRDAPDGPQAGNAIVKALRQVFAVAVEDGLAVRNPALEVSYRKGNPDGWRAWTIADVKKYAERHPPGTIAYLALALFLFTGQRLSDVYRLGPQHEQDGWLVFTQTKNRGRKPVRMQLPVIAPLKAAIDVAPGKGQLAYLTSEFGRPFRSAKSFGNRFSKWCREAGLDEGLSAHGIRKGLGDILAGLGLTAHQIMAIMGHSTLKQAEIYTRRADRKRLAGEGLAALEAAINREQIVPLSLDGCPTGEEVIELKAKK